MQNARGDSPGRRDDDRRYDRIMDRLHDLTGTLEDLKDHIEQVDDYLRGGPGGNEQPIGPRVLNLEVASNKTAALMEGVIRRLTRLEEKESAESMRASIAKEYKQEGEATRLERFKEWMKFWGLITTIILGGIGWAVQYSLSNWETLEKRFRSKSAPEIQAEIKKAKKSPRAKKVEQKIKAIEQERKELGLPE